MLQQRCEQFQDEITHLQNENSRRKQAENQVQQQTREIQKLEQDLQHMSHTHTQDVRRLQDELSKANDDRHNLA